MCGIAGMIGEIPSRKVLEQMQNTMRRRGPDQKGVWVKHGTALLHNRLAVIDIEGGRQPMQREHAVIVYNGELYNTAEVRTDLAKQGYVFSTHSDTEVVLTAYLAWGEACLERLNGIYAFAVWDMQKQELFFARDRIGVKPFFFYREKRHIFICLGNQDLAGTSGYIGRDRWKRHFGTGAAGAGENAGLRRAARHARGSCRLVRHVFAQNRASAAAVLAFGG